MNRKIRLREEADRHLAAAASWYEQQREGLGYEFLAEALTAIERLADHPLRHPIVHRDTRRSLMQRFPFGIYFRITQSHIVVVAVMHASRHPQRWRDRQ
jgi:plasmid stabilization system protein ParE